MSKLPLLKYILVFTFFDYLMLMLVLGSWGDIDGLGGWNGLAILLIIFLVSLVALLISKNTLANNSQFKPKAYGFLGASAGAYFMVVAVGFSAIHYTLLPFFDSFNASQAEGAGWFLFLGYIMIWVMALVYLGIALLNLVLLYLLEQSRLKGGRFIDKILLLLTIVSGLILFLSPYSGF